MQCGRGCSECCHQRVEITPVEAASLSEFVERLPEPRRGALTETVEASMPSGFGDPAPDVCGALARDGSCQIYEARPMPCREWGLLHLHKSRKQHDRPEMGRTPPLVTRSCRKNFVKEDLPQPSTARDLPYVFDVDEWRSALTEIDTDYEQEEVGPSPHAEDSGISLNYWLAKLLGCWPRAPMPSVE